MPNVYQFKDFEGSSHRILIELIRRSGARGRLLDLGPAGGELCDSIGDLFDHKSCIELDADRIPDLRHRFDHTIIADLDTVHSLPRGFDAIVLADVIEHLHNQKKVLAEVRESLNPDGYVFISVPNIANLTIRVGLLFGLFIYRERGILDETHVRFYTLDTVRSTLENAGFRVETIRGSSIPIRLILGTLIPNPLMKMAEWFIARTTQLWKALFAYQIIIVARLDDGDR